MIVSLEELKRYTKNYDSHGDAFIYADGKSGKGIVLFLAGDGIAIITAVRDIIKRIAAITNSTFRETIDTVIGIEEVFGDEVDIEYEERGDIQPFDKSLEEMAFEKVIDEIRREAEQSISKAENTLEQERTAFKTQLTSVRATYEKRIQGQDKKIKALNKELREKESEIRRYEKLLKDRGETDGR